MVFKEVSYAHKVMHLFDKYIKTVILYISLNLPVMTTVVDWSDCSNSTRTVTPLAVRVTSSDPLITLANTTICQTNEESVQLTVFPARNSFSLKHHNICSFSTMWNGFLENNVWDHIENLPFFIFWSLKSKKKKKLWCKLDTILDMYSIRFY